ncbi:hypothetical protein [Streptomyces roseolilacinus]|uniref:hypothetical protein n=1 Tax=Streptomyces roseolilacinus TaxID=66904 RepID=UPI0037F217F0
MKERSEWTRGSCWSPSRAIAVVEELEDGEQLFTRTLYRYAKSTCMPRTGLSSDAAVERIRAFTAWANQLATAHDRPYELIPPDPDGAVALRRFRRTIAWFIYRQPGGRIALAVQYDHAATAMSESYANPRELHLTGEKSQVASSQRAPDRLRGYYDLAA